MEGVEGLPEIKSIWDLIQYGWIGVAWWAKTKLTALEARQDVSEEIEKDTSKIIEKLEDIRVLLKDRTTDIKL